MICELLEGQLVPAVAAARGVGVPVSSWTVLRWIRRGIQDHRLEALRVGGRWFTTEEAVLRFIARNSRTHSPTTAKGAVRPEAAPFERYLTSLGLGRKPQE